MTTSAKIRALPFIKRWVKPSIEKLKSPATRFISPPLLPIQPGEISVARKIFANLIEGRAETNVRLLKKAIAAAPLYGPNQKIIRGVIFIKRKNCSNTVNVFHNDDLGAVREIIRRLRMEDAMLNQQDRVLGLQPGEIAVSNNVIFDRAFKGRAAINMRFLKPLIEAAESIGTNLKMLNGVIFTKRQNGTHQVDVFHENDKEAVRAILCGRMKAGVQADEIKISNTDDIFGRIDGRVQDNAAKLNQLIDAAEECGPDQKLYKNVVFTQRLNGTQTVNVFHLDDLEAVKAILREGKLLGLQPGEILVTRPGLMSANLAIMPANLVPDLCALLDKLPEGPENTKILDGIVFHLRKNLNRNNYAFRQVDKYALERVLIRRGIINANRIFGLLNMDLKEISKCRPEELRERLVFFMSGEERQLGALLRAYGYIADFVKGKNCQVRAMRGAKFAFDFMVEANVSGEKMPLFIEYHPLWQDKRHEKREIENKQLNVLLAHGDSKIAAEMIDLFEAPEATPQSEGAQIILGRQVSPRERDAYDIRRLLLMDLQPEFHSHRYARIKNVRQHDVFNSFLWPFYYQPQNRMSREESFQDYLQTSKRVNREISDLDQMIVPMLIGENEIAASPAA